MPRAEYENLTFLVAGGAHMVRDNDYACCIAKLIVLLIKRMCFVTTVGKHVITKICTKLFLRNQRLSKIGLTCAMMLQPNPKSIHSSLCTHSCVQNS
jgi:hypothetical protein